jgi:hypothetical protein
VGHIVLPASCIWAFASCMTVEVLLAIHNANVPCIKLAQQQRRTSSCWRACACCCADAARRSAPAASSRASTWVREHDDMLTFENTRKATV